MQVVALIEEENGRFGVTFPDFPGCTTVARSPDEAVAKAAEVLAFHAEGLAEDGPLPQPRTPTGTKRSPQLKDEGKDALPVLVPDEPPARAVQLNFTLDESLLGRIDRAANSAGQTRSGYLTEAAKQ